MFQNFGQNTPQIIMKDKILYKSAKKINILGNDPRI